MVSGSFRRSSPIIDGSPPKERSLPVSGSKFLTSHVCFFFPSELSLFISEQIHNESPRREKTTPSISPLIFDISARSFGSALSESSRTVQTEAPGDFSHR